MKSISVPLILLELQDEGFHILVEIGVFGQQFLAVLDTGASRSVFDKTLMERHVSNLTISDETQAATIFSTTTTLEGIIPKLSIGKLTLKNYVAVGLDLEAVTTTYQQLGHPPIYAIIGGDILVKYHAKIDYRKQRMRLYK